jgi:FdhE protein
VTQHAPLSPVEIEKLVEILQTLRPAYQALLDFYGKVFIAQEKSRSYLQIEPIEIPEAVLTAKQQADLPLVQMSEFAVDPDASVRLFKTLCDIAKAANDTMAVSVQTIQNELDNGNIDPTRLFEDLLAEKETCFKEFVDAFNVEKEVLTFLAYNSVKPSISHCAHQLSSYLSPDHAWEKGYCPICGSQPGLAALDHDGGRFLFCHVCWHKWKVQRLFCPFCENKDAKTLAYFYSNDEEEYRVDTCNHCHQYIKAVDTRKINRPFYPSLEQVATLHLDMKAGEEGFNNPVYLEFQ